MLFPVVNFCAVSELMFSVVAFIMHRPVVKTRHMTMNNLHQSIDVYKHAKA